VKKIVVYQLFIFFILVEFGCASYKSNSLPHTYTTETTSTMHEMSGIRITGSSMNEYTSDLSCTRSARDPYGKGMERVRMFINGQEAIGASKLTCGENMEDITLIKLPPGKHLIRIEGKSMVGFKWKVYHREKHIDVPGGEVINIHFNWVKCKNRGTFFSCRGIRW